MIRLLAVVALAMPFVGLAVLISREWPLLTGRDPIDEFAETRDALGRAANPTSKARR